MEKICVNAITFFGIVLCIYGKKGGLFCSNIFLASLTMKALSNTPWESLIKSVTTIRYQVAEIRSTLYELCHASHVT
jgi:hypothetical protein